MCSIALVAAYVGSATVTRVSNAFMKPLFFVMLIVVFIYTYTKKNFGLAVEKAGSPEKEFTWCIIIAMLLGFYDGFIGLGTGSFLILFFLSIVGVEFLKGNAHAKLVNISTKASQYFSSKRWWLIAKLLYCLPIALYKKMG